MISRILQASKRVNKLILNGDVSICTFSYLLVYILQFYKDDGITWITLTGLKIWRCEIYFRLNRLAKEYFVQCQLYNVDTVFLVRSTLLLLSTLRLKIPYEINIYSGEMPWKIPQPTNNTQQELMSEWVRVEVGGWAAENMEVKSSPDAIKILRTSISNECHQQHVVWLGRVLVAHSSWCPEHTEEQGVEKFAH